MDVVAMKKRLVLFGAIEGLAVLAAAIGFVGDLAFDQMAGRGLWIAGIGAAVAAQVWLLLGMRAGKEN